MAQSTSRKKKPQRRGRRYSPAEWFMVALGAALVILVAGIVITALLGG